MDRTASTSTERQPLLRNERQSSSTQTDFPVDIRPSVVHRNVDTDSSISFSSDSSANYTSCPAAVFLTVNACLGAGLLNFPHAFQMAGGLTFALIAQAILLVLVVGALFILSYCTQFAAVESFQDLVKYFTGKSIYKSLISLAIICYSFGSCLAFIIVIGDQIDRVLISVYGPSFCNSWYMSRAFTMTIVSICTILPLSFSKSIDFLKYPSSFGVFVIIYIIFLSFYEWLKKGGATASVYQTTGDDEESKWIDVMRVVPVICFGYQCHISWVPTFSGMREEASSKKLAWTILISMAFCAIAYTAVGVFGVLAFGNSISPDLMLNYDASDLLVLIGITIVAFKTITTYPLLLFCARTAIDDYLVWRLQIHNPERREPERRGFIVVFWFWLTLTLAIFVPDIGAVIRFIGTLAIVFIFIIPGICLISVSNMIPPHEISTFRYYLLNLIGSVYTLVGAFVFGVSLTQSIEHLLRNSESSTKPFDVYCKVDAI